MLESIHQSGEPLPEFDRLEWAESDVGAGILGYDDDGDVAEFLTIDAETMWRYPLVP